MVTTRLGASTIPVVGQGLGGTEAFAREPAAVDARVRTLRLGFDLGLTLVDTAESYGDGRSEEILGLAAAGRRDEVCIATKFSPDHSAFDGVIAAAEGSLRRLRTDRIDLYQTHWANPAIPFAETLKALADLVRSGKVRYVGLSNAPIEQIRQAADELPAGALAAVQFQYNLADRLIEHDVLPLCRELGLVCLAYTPLLDGRVVPDDARREALTAIAARCDATIGQVALAWLVGRPGVVVIPRAAREAHVRANAAAGRLALSPADVDTIDRLYAPRLLSLAPDAIDVGHTDARPVYRTVQEARANALGLVPSPAEVAAEILAGRPQRPVKVQPADGPKPYRLVEGRLRYWAWVIAHGDRVPIAALEV